VREAQAEVAYGAAMDGLTASTATQVMHQAIPATGRLGIVVERIGDGEVGMRVPIEGNANHLGTMYAGVLFSIAELPGGLIPLVFLEPGRYTPIVTDMHVRFLAPARTDVTLDARIDPAELSALALRADEEGRAEFTLELEGQDAGGRTVISTRADYQLRPSRR